MESKTIREVISKEKNGEDKGRKEVNAELFILE